MEKNVIPRNKETENLYPIEPRTPERKPSFLDKIYDKTVSCWNRCAPSFLRVASCLNQAIQIPQRVAMHLTTTFNPITLAGKALELLGRNSKPTSSHVDTDILPMLLSTVEDHKIVLNEHRCESTLFEQETGPALPPKEIATTFQAQTRKESRKLRAPLIKLMQGPRYRKETQKRLINLFKNLQFQHRQKEFYLPSDTENNGDSLIDARELAQISLYEGLLGLSREERKELNPRLNPMKSDFGVSDQDLARIKEGMRIPEILGKAAQDWSDAEIRGLILEVITISIVNPSTTVEALFSEISLDRQKSLQFSGSLNQQNSSSSVDTTDYLLRIAEDLDRLMKNESLSFQEAMVKSRVLNSIALEGLRKSRIIVKHERIATCDIESLNLKHGQAVTTTPQQLREDKNVVGPNPEQFCPARFEKEGNGWVKLDFLPFGFGPHRCPAWPYGQDVMKVVLACTSMNHQRLHRSITEVFSKQNQRSDWNDRLLKSIHHIQWSCTYPLERHAFGIAIRALKIFLQVSLPQREEPIDHRHKKWIEIPSWLLAELTRIENKNQLDDTATPFQELLFELAEEDRLPFLSMLNELAIYGMVKPMRGVIKGLKDNPSQLKEIADQIKKHMQEENIGFLEAVLSSTKIENFINKHGMSIYPRSLETFNATTYHRQVMKILLGSLSWQYRKPSVTERILAKVYRLWPF